MYFSFLGGSGLYGAGSAPDVGWWAYAPLTARAFSPGSSTDYWTIAVLLSGFGTIATAGKPMVKVVPLEASEKGAGRRLGFMEGQIVVPDDFDQMGSEDIARLFHGDKPRGEPDEP